MLGVAAFLDPRFRALSYLLEEEKQSIIKVVEEEVVSLTIPSADTPEPSLVVPPQKKLCGESMLHSLMGDIIQPTSNL